MSEHKVGHLVYSHEYGLGIIVKVTPPSTKYEWSYCVEWTGRPYKQYFSSEEITALKAYLNEQSQYR